MRKSDKQQLSVKELFDKARQKEEFLKKLLGAAEFEGWIKLKKLLQDLKDQRDRALFFRVLQQVLWEQSQIAYDYLNKKTNILEDSRQVQSFPMLMYCYQLLQFGQTQKPRRKIWWVELYHLLCIQDNQIIIFNSWGCSNENYPNNCEVIQITLQMVIQVFFHFIKLQPVKLHAIEYEAFIKWILWTQTTQPEDFQSVSRLVQEVRNMNFLFNEGYFFRLLLEILGSPIHPTGNIFLLLKSQFSRTNNIEYLCNIFYDFISDLNEEHLKNVFTNLIIGCGPTLQALEIIKQITLLLRNCEDFYKLRFIYQQFILYELVRHKDKRSLQKAIYQVCQLYIMGFLRHCDIGQKGLKVLLQNIESIQSSTIRYSWTQLAYCVAISNDQLDQFKTHVQDKNLILKLESLKLQSYEDDERIWKVTLRTAKQHKKYNKIKSKLRGIRNKGNQCYIIACIQGLYMIQDLQKLLKNNRQNIKGQRKILDQLRILFEQLQGVRPCKQVIITYLKNQGPQRFRISNSQQDAHNYLIQLLESMQKECQKCPELKNNFKNLFQIHCQSTTKCQDCGYQIKNIQNEYVHTIPHTQILHLKIEQKVPDYKCSQCGNQNCINKRVIEPKCKIFIVHINRFSHKKGKVKKEVSNQVILRKFKDYELVGMVCHIGKNVESGHYIYYSKRNDTTWIQMDDQNCYKFELSHPGEEFERQLKIDISPYILFYKRVI